MSKACFFVSWEDAPHLTADQKASMLAGIPPWQKEARSKGIPQLGSGAIYQIPESELVVPSFEIPDYWPRCYGMDVGWNKTAAVWLAKDPETGGCVVYDEYYRGQAEPSVHAAAIRNRGKWIPGVIDPAARGRSQVDGDSLLELYKGLDLDVEIANNAREAGIYAVWERMSQGKLKIFNTCRNVIGEYRIYRRDEKGNIVKAHDHALDALRYCVMSGLDRAKKCPGPANGQQWFTWTPPPVWSG